MAWLSRLVREFSPLTPLRSRDSRLTGPDEEVRDQGGTRW